MEWSDISRDLVPGILSYISLLPTYSLVCREAYEESRSNFQKLLDYMDKIYPYWYVTLNSHSSESTPSKIFWHIYIYMNRAAIEGDWDALQVISRVWNRDPKLSEQAIVSARINGNPLLARKLYEHSIHVNNGSYIDIFFRSFSWSDDQVRSYLLDEDIDIRFGWVTPNMQRIAANIYKYKYLYADFYEKVNSKGNDARYALIPILPDPYNRKILLKYRENPLLTWQELLNFIEPNKAVKSIDRIFPINGGNIELYKKYIADHGSQHLYKISSMILQSYIPDPVAPGYFIRDVIAAIRDGTPFPPMTPYI